MSIYIQRPNEEIRLKTLYTTWTSVCDVTLFVCAIVPNVNLQINIQQIPKPQLIDADFSLSHWVQVAYQACRGGNPTMSSRIVS